MGTASDGVVHSNASSIQLHPIGLNFGLVRGMGWREKEETLNEMSCS